MDESSQVREVVREVDKTTAVKLRRIAAKAEAQKVRAAVSKSRQEAKDRASSERFRAKIELAKIRASQSASEKARTNIALTSPALLMVLIGGFIIALAMGGIPDEQISVASALLTLLATGLLQNLRSIISETNGHGADDDLSPKKSPTTPKNEPKKSKSQKE